MNVYIVWLNELYDVEIDNVNKVRLAWRDRYVHAGQCTGLRAGEYCPTACHGR